MHTDSDRAGIRILVADGNHLYRTGLVRYLDQEPDFDVVGHTGSGPAVLRLISELRPDLIVLAEELPDFRLSDAVGGSGPPSAILLAASASAAGALRGLAAGARSYMSKTSSIGEIIVAIRATAGGNSWLAPDAADAVLERLRGAPAPRLPDPAGERLSTRELEVLRLLALGMDNGEIASALEISRSTAKNHVSNILTKLEVPSRVLAAIYAIRHELA